jgi:hypothetical protein
MARHGEDITTECRKLHNEERHNLPASFLRVTTS